MSDTRKRAERFLQQAGANAAAPFHEAWTGVAAKIHFRAIERRPRPKSYEVHHESEVAKEAFFEAMMSGKSPADAAAAALARVSLGGGKL